MLRCRKKNPLMSAHISHRQPEVWVAGLLCIAALMLVSFAWQYLRLQQLLQPLTPVNSVISLPTPANNAGLLQLFGSASSAANVAQKPLNIRLLGCFADVRSERSAALIALDGQAARRVLVGQQISPALRLVAVESRRVLLEQQDQQQWLNLSR